jgi:hypothetical protein
MEKSQKTINSEVPKKRSLIKQRAINLGKFISHAFLSKSLKKDTDMNCY